MSGGGNQSAGADSGGFVTDILSPLMKVVGLGIAARGGALGPMLASGGDYISQARDRRVEQDALANFMPTLLAGVQRSREIAPEKPGTPGTPGTPDVTIGTLLPGASRPVPPMVPLAAPADLPVEIPLTLPGQQPTPGTPGTPAVVRRWETGPTLSEIFARLQEVGAPQSQRAFLIRELLRSRGLPTMEQEPASVAEDVAAQRHREDIATAQQNLLERERIHRAGLGQDLMATERRHLLAAREEQERQVQALIAGGMPEAQARMTIVGGLRPAPETRVVFTPDGRRQTVDARTGRVLTDEPIRTPEEEAARTQAFTLLIPQYEGEFEAAVAQGVYRPHEAQVGRAMLREAKRTGDPRLFLKFLGDVAAERGREQQVTIRNQRALAATQPVETLTTREEKVPPSPIWRKEQFKAIEDRLSNVVQEAIPNFSVPRASIKTPSGATVTPQEYIAIGKKAIEKRFLEQHGVDVTVQWVPPSFGGLIGGTWKLVRAREPERTKSSVTERKKGPPAIISVPE